MSGPDYDSRYEEARDAEEALPDGPLDDDVLDEMHGGELMEQLIRTIDSIEAGAVLSFENLRSIAERLKPFVVGECDEMLGTYHGDTPPEPCGAETRPGDHLCSKHRKAADVMVEWEARESAEVQDSAYDSKYRRGAVAGHVEEWRLSVEVGDEATISELVNFRSTFYSDERPPAGAIAARLFPPTPRPSTLKGVEGVAVEGQPKKVRRVF